MNLKQIEQQMPEVLKIVEMCPQALQETCFDILFSELVASKSKPQGPKDLVVQAPIIEVPDETDTGKKGGETEEPEIKISDIHVKARKFLEKGITIEQINNIFYREGEEYKPLFDHLKTTKIIESQMRITLLEALKNGLKTGEFIADTKTVRGLCEVYKCYDSPNFAANFKKSAELFAEEYANGGSLSLSTAGKDKLVEVIKDLAA